MMLINLGRLLMLFVGIFDSNLCILPAPAQYFRQRGVGVHGADARYATGAAEINDTERGSADDDGRKIRIFLFGVCAVGLAAV